MKGGRSPSHKPSGGKSSFGLDVYLTPHLFVPGAIVSCALILLLSSSGLTSFWKLSGGPHRGSQFVYVYELPQRFNQELVRSEPWDSSASDGYALEQILHRLLLESNAIRTSDPEKAQLFFIPIYAAAFLEKQRKAEGGEVLEETARFIEEALRYVQKNYPYWKESNGRDHFMVASHDHGRCSSLALCDSILVGEMFTLQLYGEPSLDKLHPNLRNKIEDLNKKSGSVRDRVCYSQLIDVVIPGLSTGAAITPIGNERTIELFEAKGWGIRGQTDDKGLLSVPYLGFQTEMSEAKFCIGQASEARRTAVLTISILAGCIPVLFASDAPKLPWQDHLDYSLFTLKVDVEADPENVQKVKEEIAAAMEKPNRVQELQHGLALVQPLFAYTADGPGSKGAFAKLVAELHTRANYAGQYKPTPQTVPDVLSLFTPLGVRDGSRTLSKSLADPSAQVRLCTPKLTPMVTGTYHLGTEQAQLTVFEVEVLYGLTPGTAKRGDTLDPIISLLGFLEDFPSINRSQWHGWGGAYLSHIAEHRKMDLRCEFWPGHGRKWMKQQTPLLVTDLLVADYTQEYTLQMHCPLPSPESLPPELLTASKFQITLAPRDPSTSVLHMPTLPICRTDQLKQRSLESAGPRVRTAQGKVPLKMGICLYPYRDHRPFDFPSRGYPTQKILEWIDFHLLIGITRIYFYDRYWDEKLPLLQSYVDRGVVVHVPFPMWSEVFYRKGVYNYSSQMYAFPQSYDQMLAYEHCNMQGRRHGFDWLFFTDVDEFLSTPDMAPGSLSATMEALEEQHTGGMPLAVVRIQRFNFLDASPTQPVVRNYTQRCMYSMQHMFYDWEKQWVVDSHDKMAMSPKRMVGSKNEIHFTKQTPKAAIMVADTSAVKIHHYASTPKEEYQRVGMNFTPCKKKGSVSEVDTTLVDDSSLVWAPAAMDDCRANCNTIGQNYQKCGALCGSWPKPPEDDLE